MMIPQPYSSRDVQGQTMTFGAVSAGKSPSFLFLVASFGTGEQKRRAGRVLAGSDQPSKQEPHGEKQTH